MAMKRWLPNVVTLCAVHMMSPFLAVERDAVRKYNALEKAQHMAHGHTDENTEQGVLKHIS
jgi:hypothetical protein